MDTIKKILCLMLMVLFSFAGYSKTIKVKILNNRFDPAAISVYEGDTILWNNLSGNAMEIVSGSQCKSDGLLSSGNIVEGKEYLFVFSKKGNYNYFSPAFCSDGMRGLIMVNQKKIETGKVKSFEHSQQKKSSSLQFEEETHSKHNTKERIGVENESYALKPKEYKA